MTQLQTLRTCAHDFWLFVKLFWIFWVLLKVNLLKNEKIIKWTHVLQLLRMCPSVFGFLSDTECFLLVNERTLFGQLKFSGIHKKHQAIYSKLDDFCPTFRPSKLQTPKKSLWSDCSPNTETSETTLSINPRLPRFPIFWNTKWSFHSLDREFRDRFLSVFVQFARFDIIL